MSRSNHLGHVSHLLPALHIHSEVAGTSADHNQMPRSDYNFYLRHNHAVERSAIDDAGNSISKIATNDSVGDESLQAGAVRNERFGVEQFHVNFPLPKKAMEHSTTAATKRANSISYNRFRDASCHREKRCAVSMQLTHSRVHSAPVMLRRSA